MRVLVLSGGGAKGAYQAGAIQHLLGDLGIHYDGFCGSSVGAINAAHLAQFSAGNELDAAHSLKAFWNKVDTPLVYRKWYRGLLWHLPALWKPSIYDSSPLHEFLHKNLKPGAIRMSGRKLSVGAVSKTTGEYTTWCQSDPDIVQGVLASAAFPMFLTPVKVRGDVWQDAGAREITPVADAIHMGATEVDVICCSPYNVRQRPTRMGNLLENGLQELDVAFSEIDRNDLRMVELWNALVDAKSPLAIKGGKKRITLRVLRPTHELLKNSLDFSPDKVRRNLDSGYADAKRLVW